MALTVIFVFMLVVVTTIIVTTARNSGAGVTSSTPTRPAKPAPENHCPQARKALRFYIAATNAWRSKMGAAAQAGDLSRRDRACPRIHYLVRLWVAKAHAARLAFVRWHEYEYAWWKWMPDKWQRIGACETGYGRRPGDFHWNSGTYQGFVGFYYGSWDAYRPANFPSEAYNATPREQMIVAENIRAAVGYGAWGCGGA